MLDSPELGNRLRKAMEDAQKTGADLAAHCGVTPQAVSSWRKTGRIGKRHLKRVAEYLGKSLEYFLSEKGINERKTNGSSPEWLKESVSDQKSFYDLFRAWQDTDEEGRKILLGAVASVRMLDAAKARSRRGKGNK